MTAIPNNTSPSQSNTLSPEEVEKSKALLAQWVTENHSMLEVFLDAYCVVDLSNQVVDFNTAFTELCGESYRKILKIGNFCDLVKTEFCPGQCPATQILTSEKALRLDEVSGSSKSYPTLHMILGGVPIFSPDKKVLGSLLTIRNVSAESELQKKYDERKKDSITDGLTRLYNKVYTESALIRGLKLAARDKQVLSVIMCDVDHFKHVNDKFGHQAGDYVLSTVAQMLKGESRDSDTAGRFGGEEFVVVLPNTNQEGALVFAERFRKRLESTQVIFESKHIPLTISIGTSTFKGDPGENFTAEGKAKELVGQGDTALYLAKANGRNQTWQFENIKTQKTEAPPKK